MKLTKFVKEEVENTTYIKLAINKAHFGPVSEEKVALRKARTLSAAANKVRVTAGFSIKVSNDKDQEKPNVSQNRSFLFRELGDDSPKTVTGYSVLLMQAWDNIFQSEGTPEYVERLANGLKARAMAYSKLGINPVSGSKPDLSADQRVVYNSVVGPTGFDYYEYHLAFKLEGQKKFVRSKTYRSLRPINLNRLLELLSNEVDKLNDKITLISRQTN